MPSRPFQIASLLFSSNPHDPLDGQIPSQVPPGGELQAAVAVSESGQTLDVTDRVNEDAQLEWTPPSGGWKLWVASRSAPIQKVKRPAPGNEGYALDPFSPAAMRAYLQRFTKAFDGFSAPLPNAQFHESFEYFGADWSSGVFEAFLKGRGYDLRTQLPAFAGAAPEDKVARGRSFALTPDFCRHPFGAPASVVCGRLDSP